MGNLRWMGGALLASYTPQLSFQVRATLLPSISGRQLRTGKTWKKEERAENLHRFGSVGFVSICVDTRGRENGTGVGWDVLGGKRARFIKGIVCVHAGSATADARRPTCR
ncbi:hypothetical protein V2G26_000529 [Clonostachys chloroleuca]